MVAGTVPGPPLESAFESATTAPPEGAAPVSVTVPVDDAPPTRLTGLIVTALTVVGPPGGISGGACAPGLPARSALMFMLNCELTGAVGMVTGRRVRRPARASLGAVCETTRGPAGG